ncbi:MAG: 5'/3'-nucleotidase SurE [Firmicutes bacterium]|nr:5'/3'-nucleotidase SurE [Bacillota bacterium]
MTENDTAGDRAPAILVTNDDGVYAEGLRALARELSGMAHVTVVAPDRERSAIGHAITVHHPLRVDPVDLGLGVPCHSVNGTPSDCVKLAVDAVMERRPDLVVSGINRGPNLGTDVIYSGTVSAALEGTIAGIPSIAVSLGTGQDRGGPTDHVVPRAEIRSSEVKTCDYGLAARFVAGVARRILEENLPPEVLLNINIPACPVAGLEEVQITRLGQRKYHDVLHRRTDPRGRAYYWLAGEVLELDEDPDTDGMALRSNRISITPIHLDLTMHSIIPRLRGWRLTLDQEV